MTKEKRVPPEFEKAFCFIPGKHYCPFCGEHSWLLKLAIIFHAIMTLAMTITLVLLCILANNVNNNVIKHMEFTASSEGKIINTVNSAQRTTMENRAIQAENRGLLRAILNERRLLREEKANEQR